MPRLAVLPNLLPGRLDLINYRGDRLSALIRLHSQGLPLNITGFDFEAHVRATADGALIAQFEIERLSDENGEIRLILSADQSQLINGLALWDLQSREVADPNNVRTIIRGQIRSAADVTRPD